MSISSDSFANEKGEESGADNNNNKLTARTKFIARLEANGNYATWVLIAALGGMFATTFPITILAVSLTSIANDFGVSTSFMTWVITAPMVFSAIALPIMGKLGDLYGHRRVFLVGFLFSTFSTFLSAAAWDAPSLIVLRTITAIIGSATQPTAMALIFSVFMGDARLKAMGWWGMTTAAAPAMGLIIGGPLVDVLGWQVVFIVQGAFSLIALVFAHWVLKETKKQAVKFDIPGAFFLAIAVGCLMFAITQAKPDALTRPEIIGAIVIGIISLFVFIGVERKITHPLLPLDFFRLPNFTFAMLSSSFMSAAYMGAFVLAPVVLIQQFHFSMTQTSFIMLLRTLSLTISSPFGSKLGTRFGQKSAALIGTSLITISLAMISYGIFVGLFWWVAVGLVLQGCGHGFSLPSLNSAVANSVPEENLGIASATNRLITQIGTAFGITALTTLYGLNETANGLIFAIMIGALLSVFSTSTALFMKAKQ